jgi:hypothetical protein
MRPAMKTILLSLLVTGLGAAAAEPQPAPPAGATKPPKLACEAKGTAIFEIDHLTTQSPKEVLAGKLYATGAWTFAETTAEGKAGQAETGCADPAAIKKLQTELAAAKWKITMSRIRCMAMSPNFTRYLVHGKQVLEQHTCDGQVPDEASQKALTDATELLAPAFAAQKPVAKP